MRRANSDKISNRLRSFDALKAAVFSEKVDERTMVDVVDKAEQAEVSKSANGSETLELAKLKLRSFSVGTVILELLEKPKSPVEEGEDDPVALATSEWREVLAQMAEKKIPCASDLMKRTEAAVTKLTAPTKPVKK